MLPDSALKSMNVMFATPCYISGVTMNYVASIFSFTCDAMHLGLKCILHLHSESLIPRGRNKMVLKFLAEEQFTHLFWIDSDIAFDPRAVFRLLLADRDVAAGVYPMKSFHWPAEGVPGGMTQRQFEDRYTQYPFNPINHGATRVSPYVDGEGFVEVAEAPTGFMAIKRHVFKQLMEKYPELNYTPDGPPNHPQAHLHWRFFDCMTDPDSGRYLSEDYAFCRRWRDIGGKIWSTRLQAHAPRTTHVPRRSRRKPAHAGPLVRARAEQCAKTAARTEDGMDPRTQRLLEGPITSTLLRLAGPNVMLRSVQAAIGLIETYFVASSAPTRSPAWRWCSRW